MLQLCHMKQFAITSAEQLTPGVYNTREWGYNRLKTGHVLPRRLYEDPRFFFSMGVDEISHNFGPWAMKSCQTLFGEVCPLTGD